MLQGEQGLGLPKVQGQVPTSYRIVPQSRCAKLKEAQEGAASWCNQRRNSHVKGEVGYVPNTPLASYPGARSEAPAKPQIENTRRRERVLPSAQMDAKFLHPHKLGPAPAADSGSSGPRGTGKAEPGSGKALALWGGSIQI